MPSSSSKKARMAASVASVMYTNAVYFPNYRIYQGDTPGAMNYKCISHVFYAHANVGTDGGVYVCPARCLSSAFICRRKHKY